MVASSIPNLFIGDCPSFLFEFVDFLLLKRNENRAGGKKERWESRSLKFFSFVSCPRRRFNPFLSMKGLLFVVTRARNFI